MSEGDFPVAMLSCNNLSAPLSHAGWGGRCRGAAGPPPLPPGDRSRHLSPQEVANPSSGEAGRETRRAPHAHPHRRWMLLVGAKGAFPGSAKDERGVWKANKGREGKYLGEKTESISYKSFGRCRGRCVCAHKDAVSSNFDLPGHLACGHPPYVCLQGRPRDMRDWERGMKTQSKMLAVSHAPRTLSFKAGRQHQPRRKGRRWRSQAASSPGSPLFPRLPMPWGAVATVQGVSWSGRRSAEAGSGERRATFGECALGLISTRPENGCSEPRWCEMPSGMGTGCWAGWRGWAMFGVLAVTDPKCQQAWGQHPGYKNPLRDSPSLKPLPLFCCMQRWSPGGGMSMIADSSALQKKKTLRDLLTKEKGCFPLPCEQGRHSSFTLQAMFLNGR